MLEQPWALTLWTYFQLTERDRIRAIRRRIETADAAVLTSLAFNDPPKLKIEQDAARAAAKQTPITKAKDDAEWQAARDRLLAAIERGKLLDNSPS